MIKVRKNFFSVSLLMMGVVALPASAFSLRGLDDPTPHFFVKMENRMDKPVAISFREDKGNVFLTPSLADEMTLAAHQTSLKYAVSIVPLDPKSTFNIVFKGKQECTFNMAFYAPANPAIFISGPGCAGGGYSIIDNGYTLLLYVSNINM